MKKRNAKLLLKSSAGLVGGVAALWGAKKAAKQVVKHTANASMKALMTQPYEANMFELFSSVKRVGIQEIMETNLRSETGSILQRPMGTPKKFPSLDQLAFAVAQLHVMPTELTTPVDLTSIIGKKAKKPLRLTMPIIIAGMGYGVALSKGARLALAKGSALAKIPIGSGQGPILDEERRMAHQYIYQYNRSTWGNRPQDFEKCDAIEVQLGQGAIAGVGHVSRVKDFDKSVREQYGFSKDEIMVTYSRIPAVQQADQLAALVARLKDEGGGVPVGVKMSAGKYLEADMQIACDSGVDFIIVGSAEAGSKGSPPILQDDFGLPSLYAFSRAGEWMYKTGSRASVSLIAAGKIRTPGDALKALALGADACYIGTIALFAISHTQLTKVMPFDPPTQLIWHGGEGEKKFNHKEGADTLHKFLNAFQEELSAGVRALGTTKITDVTRKELTALDEETAKGCKVPMAYESYFDS